MFVDEMKIWVKALNETVTQVEAKDKKKITVFETEFAAAKAAEDTKKAEMAKKKIK